MKASKTNDFTLILPMTMLLIGGLILSYELLQNALSIRVGYWLSCFISMGVATAMAAVIAWGALREKRSKGETIQRLQTLSVEHQEMGQQLCEVLDLNSQIISDAPVGIAVYKPSGECVVVNEAAARIIGTTLANYLKHNFRELESWQESGMLKTAEETLATGETRQMDFHGITTMGNKEVWMVCHFSSVLWAHQPHLLLILNDVTARKLAEEKIREQAALLDHAHDAIFVLELDGRVTYWNQGSERLYGWTSSEAIGKNPVDLMFRGMMTPVLRKAIDATREKGEWNGELTKTTRDGKIVVVQGRSTLVRDAQGKPRAILVIDTEITEKKRLEEQFLRSQRMESLGTLASGIAHDLNNVLTPLLIAVQVLRQKARDADDRMLLEALESNVHRGADLVKQVLTFGRGIVGERLPFPPLRVVREIEKIVHHTFPKSIEFAFDAPKDLWSVNGDASQFHQVLLNLCVNARDAMPAGGKLSIHLENIVVDDVYAEANPGLCAGSYVLITVADTGSGIPKAIQSRVFEPFFTTKNPGAGTGLGLSTSLGIIKSHGGFINCYSEPGQGTAFKVYLPAGVKPAVTKNISPPADLSHGRNQLVLVVDDEEPIRKVAQAVLEHAGYRCLLAADGSEAIAIFSARSQEIAAIITDIAMPVMDGTSAAAVFTSTNPGVVIIGSSGLDTGMEMAAGAGIKYFIRKPYTADAMLRTLDRALKSSRGSGFPSVMKTAMPAGAFIGPVFAG
jgi:PAS domain S-box-containing protein